MAKDRISELEQNRLAQGGGIELSGQVPLADGVGNPGTSSQAARADHVHPKSEGNDIYVKKSGDEMTGILSFPTTANTDVFVRTALVTGESNANNRRYAKAHSIEMGTPNKNYMNFNEYGGIFNFYKTNEVYGQPSGDGTHLMQLNSSGFLRFPSNGGLAAKDGSSPIIVLQKVNYESIDPTHTTDVYFRELLKWICRNYPNVSTGTWIGHARPNSQGLVLITIYDTDDVNNQGLPNYSSGIWFNINLETYRFGTNQYNYQDKYL